MVELTRSTLNELVSAYAEEEPFHLVERDRLETLPSAVRDDQLVWKDAEWIVRWYFRRHLDGELADERRTVEARFRDNPWDAVRAAMVTARTTDDLDERLAHLTDLEGIDVPVASAFLSFIDPERDPVMGPREWRGLRVAHELRRDYPARPSVADYATFRRRCRTLADRLGVDLVAVQRALWRLAGPDAP